MVSVVARAPSSWIVPGIGNEIVVFDPLLLAACAFKSSVADADRHIRLARYFKELSDELGSIDPFVHVRDDKLYVQLRTSQQ